MKTAKAFALILGLLGLFALPPHVGAATNGTYTLTFIPTHHAPGGAQGNMTLKVVNGETLVHFHVKGGFPNTLYTIWTVFNVLKEPLPTAGHEVPSLPAGAHRPGFPPEGSPVSPLARLDAAFTAGMRIDPGASFVTDRNGNGEIELKLDYDLVREAPVSSKDIILQCAPTPTNCKKEVRLTTTWLRRFIGEFPQAQRASMCANYDPMFDLESPRYDAVRSKGMDAQLWQCVDPASVDAKTGSGLPRVQRFTFDHFRLANHPDSLTHGFVGGSPTDHWIDLVGRYKDLVPR